MIPYRIIERPSFRVTGRKAWITGQDNNLFGQFWEESRAQGLLERLGEISHGRPGAQTSALTLGISRVENDPSCRAFYYMIAVETSDVDLAGDLESFEVPAGYWAVFTCRGKVPELIVEAEIFAFTRWLPGSPYQHALAPEMGVYLPGESSEDYTCEFWLPILPKG